MVGFYRFFLASLVLYSHLNYPYWQVASFGINQGVYAVFCFYVISGYFTALIYDRFQGDGRTLRFYVDRLLRIMPTFWAVMLLVGVIGLFWYEPSLGTSEADYRRPSSWFSAALQPLNGILAFFFRGDFPYGPFASFTPVASLALEVQFFALFPLLVRMRVKWLVAAIVVIASFVIHAALSGNPDRLENYTYRYLFGVLPTFLLGFLFHQYRHSKRSLAWCCRCEVVGPAIGVSYLVTLWLAPLPSGAWLGEMGLALITCPWLLRIALRTSSSKLDHLAGYLSYGIFLVHIPVIRFGQLKADTGLEFLIALVVATAVALLIHWVVEKPVLRWRHRNVDRNESLV